MGPKTKEWVKTWVSPITTVVAICALGWNISKTMGGLVRDELKELHQNTRDIKAMQTSHSEYKADMQEVVKKMELRDDGQDAKIEENKTDITRLLTQNRK